MDDEGPIRELLSKMLQSFGYSVVAKESGKETMDIFIQRQRNNIPSKRLSWTSPSPGKWEARRWQKR